jgi:Holliday junction resolvase
MRRAAKVDDNQSEIVAALRAVGATVQPLHSVGKGCPDLVAGYRGQNFLIEIKDGSKRPSERKLTADQVEWHGGWKGAVHVAETVRDALSIIGAVREAP